MRKLLTANAVLLGALLAISTSAKAADVKIDMSLVVPSLCTVRTLSPATLENNVLSVEVQEMCNHSNYHVVLMYTPGTLKGAVADYGGRQTELDGSGIVTLSRSAVATNRVGYLSIRVNEGMVLPSSLHLSTNPV